MDKSLFRYCDNEVGREKVHVAEKLYLKFRTFCNYYLIIRWNPLNTWEVRKQRLNLYSYFFVILYRDCFGKLSLNSLLSAREAKK